jgi:hypothetical protein
MNRHVRRALLGLTSVATSTALVAGAGISAPAQAATPSARSAAGWLASEIDRQNPFKQEGFPQYGPTLDAFFALSDLRLRKGARGDVLRTLEPDTYQYVGSDGESYAGPTGKLVTAVQLQGRRVARFADGNLLNRLEALVDRNGPDAGRAKDDSQFGDFSNTIGQQWVVRALSQADSPLADEALGFLMKQQCDAGWFRESMDSADSTCDGGTAGQSSPSVDATAYAVEALLAARRNGVNPAPRAMRAALRSAGRWLASVQRPNGAFRGAGAVSSDSTGLAAVALDALGRDARALKAARWIKKNQVTLKVVRKTALKKRDLGAVAPTRLALKQAKKDGIGASRINWRLATAQAGPALDLLRRARR